MKTEKTLNETKAKAKKLVDEFYHLNIPQASDIEWEIDYEGAKCCALIYVDGLLENLNALCIQAGTSEYFRQGIRNFWVNVKKEIEIL